MVEIGCNVSTAGALACRTTQCSGLFSGSWSPTGSVRVLPPPSVSALPSMLPYRYLTRKQINFQLLLHYPKSDCVYYQKSDCLCQFPIIFQEFSYVPNQSVGGIYNSILVNLNKNQKSIFLCVLGHGIRKYLDGSNNQMSLKLSLLLYLQTQSLFLFLVK